MAAIRRAFRELVPPPKVVLEVLLVLAVHSVHLAVDAALGEERGQEKLREPIQCTLKVRRQDIEKVVCLEWKLKGVQ